MPSVVPKLAVHRGGACVNFTSSFKLLYFGGIRKKGLRVPFLVLNGFNSIFYFAQGLFLNHDENLLPELF